MFVCLFLNSTQANEISRIIGKEYITTKKILSDYECYNNLYFNIYLNDKKNLIYLLLFWTFTYLLT